MRGGTNIQMVVPPFTPVVKKLVIANLAVWFLFVFIGQQFFMDAPYMFQWFGLVPYRLIADFWLWQPFTYMFLHSESVFHIVFNMLMLWFLGAELEQRWGSRFFILYYMVCGVGAGVLYFIGLIIYYLFTSNAMPLQFPVVGASGAVFGLILAYGILFGERVIYFMMIFPMKAKYFVMILGAIEFVSLLNTGVGGQVANLAHLGGIVSGFLFLILWSRWQANKRGGRKASSAGHRRKLKLVVDNERQDEGDGPRYWN